MTDYQKTPSAQYLSQFAAKVVARFIAQLGKSLPGQVISFANSIVKAKFTVQSQYNMPTVTVPMMGSEYIRLPIQPGDLGGFVSFDASLGQTSGLGTGTPILSQKQGNLANLAWTPISNQNWSPTDDPDAVVI